MKEFIVMIAMICLGVFIFMAVAGPGDESIASNLGRLWERGVEVRTYTP